MSEEAANAATAVPFGIILSIAMCGVLGFALNAILSASIADFSQVLATPLGQPMAQIYLNTLGQKWTMAMMVLLFVVQWFMGLSILIAASRQTWAFSRDGALPFSNWIRVVNLKLHVPVRAVIFDGCVGIVIGLLVLVDQAAANALFSLAPASNGLAWMLPIACRHIFFDKDAFKPGPFYLGHRLSRANGLFATVYLCFVVFVLSQFPTQPNPSKDNMNYTFAINAFVWFGALAYYFISGRHWFEGPKHTVDEVVEGVEAEGDEKPNASVVKAE
jgi:amino acid transporter